MFSYVCAKRRGCLPVGLLLILLGLAHQTLSPLWIRYFHLTGHFRSLSVDFASGLVLGLGVMLLVGSFSNQNS